MGPNLHYVTSHLLSGPLLIHISYSHMKLLATPIRRQPYISLGLVHAAPPGWNTFPCYTSELLHQGPLRYHSPWETYQGLIFPLPPSSPRQKRVPTFPIVITTLYIHFSSHTTVCHTIRVETGVLYLSILRTWYRVAPQQILVKMNLRIYFHINKLSEISSPM